MICPYISLRAGSLESERDYWKREADRLYYVAKEAHIKRSLLFEIIQKHGLINEMRIAFGLEPDKMFEAQP